MYDINLSEFVKKLIWLPCVLTLGTAADLLASDNIVRIHSFSASYPHWPLISSNCASKETVLWIMPF